MLPTASCTTNVSISPMLACNSFGTRPEIERAHNDVQFSSGDGAALVAKHVV